MSSEIVSEVPKYFSLGHGKGKNYHTRLRLGLSGLNDHLFKCNLIPYRTCNRCTNNTAETTEHFLLYCPKYSDIRKDLFRNLQTIVGARVNFDIYIKYCSKYLVQLLLFGSEYLSDDENFKIFQNVFEYLVNSDRF